MGCWEAVIDRKEREMALKPLMTEDRAMYKRQLREKACTVCRYVGVGGRICRECGVDRKNWKNAFVEMVRAS